MSLTALRGLFHRLVILFRSSTVEEDLTREIAVHLRLLEDKYVAQGMTKQDAHDAARRAFGGVEQAKEHQRDARTFRWIAGWGMDLKLGTRMLIKSPGLTVVAVIALAVAIGGGAAYFEFFNDVFRPTLRFAGADRLVGIAVMDLAQNDLERRTAHAFGQWRERLRTVEELGAARAIDQNLITDDGRAEPVRGVEISPSAFRILPVRPLLGRPLNADDERPGAPAVVLLGYETWHSRFGSDPSAVGKTLRLGGTTHTIVGVMPAEFGFPVNHTLWTPLRLDTNTIKPGEGPAIRLFGRLAAGSSLDAAQAEVEAVGAAAAPNQRLRPIVKPYVESLWASREQTLQVKILFAINLLFVGLLAVCGANVATLVFARTASREGEIAVRTAIGASRSRIVLQLIAEALVLTASAAIVGLAGASTTLRWARDVWVDAQAQPMPFWWNEQLGVDTILYTVLLVGLASLLVGGVPALKATGARLQGRLKLAGSTGSTMRFGKLWTGVIVMQVALTVIFLLSVLALSWSARVSQQDLVNVTFPREKYLTAMVAMDQATPSQRRQNVLQEFQRRLAQNPSIENASVTTRLPGMEQEAFLLDFAQPEIAVDAKRTDGPLSVGSTQVGANYFETFDTPFVAGRGFTLSEIEAGSNVAVVDESFVRLVLGGRAAVGQMVRQPAGGERTQPGPWFEIVGVVKDLSTKENKRSDDAMLYRPLPSNQDGSAYVAVHFRGDATGLGTELRLAAAAADPTLRLYEVRTLDKVAESEAMTMSFFVRSMAVVGAVALLLSTAGIYSLISFTLTRRTREIGVRIALGASSRQVISGILSRAFLQIGVGVVVGMLPGIAIVANGGDLGPGVTVAKAISLSLLVAAFVVIVAGVACTVPLRRALHVEPTQALRADG
jgi:putative ABC transport system permease protein